MIKKKYIQYEPLTMSQLYSSVVIDKSEEKVFDETADKYQLVTVRTLKDPSYGNNSRMRSNLVFFTL